MKKLFVSIVIAMLAILGAMSVNAQDMALYVGGQYMVRDIQNIAGFDMIPIEDMAGELGFTTWFDGYELTLYGTDRTYYFHVDDANVWDNAGGWYGLDVTPRVMEGKIRIPGWWLVDALGKPYTYDWKTNTLFIDSDYTYNWLINTPEYQNDVKAETPALENNSYAVSSDVTANTAYAQTDILTKDNVSIKLKVPKVGASDNDYAYVLVDNKTDYSMELSSFAVINGSICNTKGSKDEVVAAHSTKEVTYYRDTMGFFDYTWEHKHWKNREQMYLDNNSTARVTSIEHNGNTYVIQFDKDGIIDIEKK